MNAILFSYLLPLVHVLACFFLIVVVLLQTGKGADMGAVLGGGSQTLFGASGAGNLLTKLTTGMAITFMATSLIIAVGQRQKPSSSLIDRLPDAPAVGPIDLPPPAVPAPTGAAAPAAPGDAARQADAKPADAPLAPSAAPAADAKPADTPAAPAPPAAIPPVPAAAPTEAPSPAAP